MWGFLFPKHYLLSKCTSNHFTLFLSALNGIAEI